MIPPVIYALGANLTFSTASIVYAEYSRKFSPKWMNLVKASIAMVAFSLTVFAFDLWQDVSMTSFGLLLLSGSVGLMIGDLFLLRAFTIIGPARSLMIFGFSPVFLGVSAFFIFNQQFEWFRLIAIIFLILCLFTFSLESYKKSGNWELRGLLFGFLGVFLDSLGILMTRAAFDHSPEMSPLQGNMFRAIGAVGLFIILKPVLGPYYLREHFHSLTRKARTLVIVASLAGTYLSLMLYLTAVKSGHLASISAVAITAPLFASLFECIRQKRWPTIYLLVGLSLFCIGFFILVLAGR